MASVTTAAEAGVYNLHPYVNNADKSIAVARIAYLSSDVILSIQPALSTHSDFSKHLHSYSTNRLPGLVAKETPEVSLREDLRLWSAVLTLWLGDSDQA